MQPHPDPTTPGRSIARSGRSELRARGDRRAELERLGLFDLDAWRAGRLAGEVVHRRAERQVLRLAGEHGPLFAKYQRGRRVREWFDELLHLRRPRSAAGREERAARALAKIDVGAPRVLLDGETRSRLGIELESFLVTEPLAGRPVTEVELDAPTREALGRLVARLSAERVAVPDLYAKHLFVARTADSTPRLALLDLPRVEPRSRRGARELFVRHAGGLVATLPGLGAAQLAAHAPDGDPDLVRRIENRADLVRRRKKLPLEYSARERYARIEDVQAYRSRSEQRNARELRILEDLVPRVDGGVVVDVPCGAGRFSALLRARGARVLALDLSAAMVRAAAPSAAGAAVGELERLPLATDCAQGALCFRLLHHIPTAAQRRRVLAELTRVAREFVVLSFFHPISAHNSLRTARHLLTRRPLSRHTASVHALRRDLRELGWRVDALRPDSRFLRDLWVLRAVPEAAPAARPALER